jgi:Right handed beta helix region
VLRGVRRLGRGTAAAALALSLLVTAPAAAATFEPTRKDDPVPNGCKPRNCSLREAMQAADNRQGRDEVILARGRYELELPHEGAGAYSGSFDLIDGVVLRGRGPRTKIDANDLDQVMTSWSNGTQGSFRLQDLTLTGGNAGVGVQDHGGGILVGTEDKMTLKRVIITDNVAPTNGGGVASTSPELTVKDSKIADNEAFYGGGIHVAPNSASAVVDIRGSVIRGNEAPFGGGVYGRAPDLRISRSTITRNAADEGGGMDLVSMPDIRPNTVIGFSTISRNSARKGAGILTDGNQPGLGLQKPIVSLANSSVAGNLAAAEGGGIMADNAAEITLDNTTVAHNTADVDSIAGGDGGGIHQHSGASFTFTDSIVAANLVGTTGVGAECQGTFTAENDVVQNQTTGSCAMTGTQVILADALIGPLGDYGGPTETVKLLSGSPAIGLAATCPKRDQRGQLRPNNCDSGSFENKPRR